MTRIVITGRNSEIPADAFRTIGRGLASQGGSGCRRTTGRERANGVDHAPPTDHKAAGNPRTAPAADWSEPVVMAAWLGAFLLGFAMAWNF